MRSHVLSISEDTEFAVEKLKDVYTEIRELWVLHWEEIAAYQDKIRLNPDMEKYRMLQGNGDLLICTIRRHGVLVGYSFYILTYHLHYSEDRYAMNDLFYIHPDHRGGMALRFMRYCEDMLKPLNISVISMHMKVNKPFDALCLRQGYDFQEKIYTKCIKE